MKKFLFFDWKIVMDTNFREFINDDEFIILNIENTVIANGKITEDMKIKLNSIPYDIEFTIGDKILEFTQKTPVFYEPEVTTLNDIFVMHSDEMDNMSNIEKAEYLINSSCSPMCDTCLSSALDITPVNQVNQICNKLKKQERIRREEELCPLCNKLKKCNRKFV
ncbi:MAG: hypothetical protein ACRC6T_12400 [Sarcina sp.]